MTPRGAPRRPPRGAHRRRNRQLRPSRSHPLESFFSPHHLRPVPQIGTKFTLVLAPTLSLDGTPEDPAYDQSGKESLADSYEYVMYGKVFKKQDENEGGIRRSAVTISFGGLLMQLKADPKNLQDVDIDNRLYVLIRKIS